MSLVGGAIGGLLSRGGNSPAGQRFGADFQAKLQSWKQGVGSPVDKIYTDDFRKKLRTLEATVGPIPFGVDATAQSGTLSKLTQRTSNAKLDISSLPSWAKYVGVAVLALIAFLFFKRKKRRK